MEDLKDMIFDLQPSEKDDRDYLAKELICGTPIILQDEFWAGDKEGYKVYDQYNTSRCTAFSCGAILSQYHYQEHGEYKRFNPNFIYGARFEKYETQREGNKLKNVYQDMQKYGMPFYDDFNTTARTVDECMEAFKNASDGVLEEAKKHRIDFYYKVNHENEEEILELLHKFKTPIGISWKVWNGMKRAFGDGVLESTYEDSDGYVGNHMSVLVGYKKINEKYYWIILNSWGEYVGDKGYFYIPFNADYINEMWFSIDYKPRYIEIPMNEKHYTVNGKVVEIDTNAVIINDRIYIPLRALMEELNAIVKYDDENKLATIIRGIDKFYFSLLEDETTFFRNSAYNRFYYEDDIDRRELTKHFVDENDRTLVPIRKPFEIIVGAKVSWDNDRKMAIIEI